MVAIAIGVAGPEKLPFLPAALNCADQFFKWATAMGYEARLITDENSAVTVDRLREEFEAVLEVPTPIHRMVIYFAGHGMIRELESGLWLLSDWKTEGLAVAYESMRRRLATFGISQIAIFSDACRSLPKSVFELQLEERSVLAPGSSEGEPDVDKFVAARPGKEAFALPGSTEKDDVCVFSGVLLEALWGLKKEAFSDVVTGSITSSSLGKHLKTEVPLAAKKYGLTLVPSVAAAFPEGDNIYFAAGTPPAAAPPFDWPALPGPPVPALPGDPFIPAPGHSDRLGVEVQPGAAEGNEVFRRARKAPAPTLVDRLRGQKLPPRFETGSGFAVEGAAIRRLWTSSHVIAKPHLEANWWMVSESNGQRLVDPAPILIEFGDGRFAAVSALPNFVTGLVCDTRGVSAVAYRSYEFNEGAPGAEDAIDALERGTLRADAVTDMAVQLRMAKHRDPVLGVFAAYLYDSVGDVGNIRRMAYYYIQERQPIPYDIALLAQVRAYRQGDRLVAQIPTVPLRSPKPGAEERYGWTHEATPAADGVVGGAWPWLRQGWVFLADPTDPETTLIPHGLASLAKNLAPSRFATFDSEGGLKLASLFGLVPREPR
jgi:hypothetical protein